MAEEYIKRKDATTAFGNYLGATSVRAYVAAEKILSTVPSEDVRPVVHGRWEREEDTCFGFTDVEHRCSQCGKAYSGQGFCAFHFCPNCGADMGEAKT